MECGYTWEKEGLEFEAVRTGYKGGRAEEACGVGLGQGVGVGLWAAWDGQVVGGGRKQWSGTQAGNHLGIVSPVLGDWMWAPRSTCSGRSSGSHKSGSSQKLVWRRSQARFRGRTPAWERTSGRHPTRPPGRMNSSPRRLRWDPWVGIAERETSLSHKWSSQREDRLLLGVLLGS